MTDAARQTRRKCAQDAMFKALGFDYNAAYYVMGCNVAAMWDFEKWARAQGCGWEPYEGCVKKPSRAHSSEHGPTHLLRRNVCLLPLLAMSLLLACLALALATLAVRPWAFVE